jgi:hypothetical protein
VKVLANREHVESFPILLLNRPEKHTLRVEDILALDELDVVSALRRPGPPLPPATPDRTAPRGL